jgi:hypothetical protein
MNKQNKYKQNYHNGRAENRRRQRARTDFRAGTSQWDRTVTPLAKTSTVQILTISNVSSNLLDAIDELAARQDRSRSSFVRRELERVVVEYRAKETLGKSQ